jgi:hypothetical protein
MNMTSFLESIPELMLRKLITQADAGEDGSAKARDWWKGRRWWNVRHGG